MQLARYTIQIPTVDNEGNQLVDIATAAHESLFRHTPGSGGIEGSKIYRGVAGNWRDDPQETFDELVTFAEDSPEIDSTIKELATHIAELANQWGVMVFKEGSGAPKIWMMKHPNTTGEGPADSIALQNQDDSEKFGSVLRRKKRPY